MPDLEKATATVEMLQFATFRVGGRLCGVDILQVREINTEMRFTPVYHTPDYVRGLVNIRGSIYLILDIRVLFHEPPVEITPASRLILFKTEVGENFGILVDTVGDIVAAHDMQIEDRRRAHKLDAAGLTADLADEVIASICKLDGELLLILKPDALLQELAGREAGGDS